MPVSVTSRVFGVSSSGRPWTAEASRPNGVAAARRPARVSRRGRGGRSAARRRSASRAVTAPPSSARARLDDPAAPRWPGQPSRCGPRRPRVGTLEVGRSPQGHQLVGDLRAPAGYVEVGELVGDLGEGGAEPGVGLARGPGPGAARRRGRHRHTTPAPARHRHQPEVHAAQDDRLTGLERLGVERGRARQADRVARDRQGDAGAGGTLGAERAERQDQRHASSSAPGSPTTSWAASPSTIASRAASRLTSPRTRRRTTAPAGPVGQRAAASAPRHGGRQGAPVARVRSSTSGAYAGARDAGRAVGWPSRPAGRRTQPTSSTRGRDGPGSPVRRRDRTTRGGDPARRTSTGPSRRTSAGSSSARTAPARRR